MTTSKILGIQRVNFKAQDGNSINGYNIFFYYQKEGVDGYATGKAFVSEKKFLDDPVKLNQSYVILYNQFGKIDGFMPVPTKEKS